MKPSGDGPYRRIDDLRSFLLAPIPRTQLASTDAGWPNDRALKPFYTVRWITDESGAALF